MTVQNEQNSLLSVLRSLVGPVVLGMIPYAAFLLLIKHGVITNELVLRYCAGHVVSYVATGMFFVGLAALALKAADVSSQFSSLGKIGLPDPPHAGQKVKDAAGLLDGLELLAARVRRTYLCRRLHDALQHVERKESAEHLDDELKYLSDMDAGRQHESYSLVRIITWATPMLGFLGTVVGIAAALGEFELRDNNFQEAVQGLKGGLFVAFDTTALALCLTIALMFVQFLVDRVETHLLGIVDARTAEDLVGRFEEAGAGSDPAVKSIERMGHSILESTHQLVERQSQLWQSSMEEAQGKWTGMTDTSAKELQSALAAALDETLARHAQRMAKIEQDTADQRQHRLEQWQVALSENARVMHAQQKELIRQGEIMASAVQATGDVIKLEQALNDNLQSLSGAKNFEDTVMSLSAAIHLLNSRLGHPTETRHVDLTKSESQGRAA